MMRPGSRPLVETDIKMVPEVMDVLTFQLIRQL